ncbi:MAG: LysR family transcriptional regulator [candidate division NC10 bacterium]|nr:LysR family transcriptional regulator [candidate division NC10 bacterium]
MTLGQLRTFVALADTGSGRAAANRLVVSQPAVSAAVAALQREVGVALVSREGRGLRLTEAGEIFAGYARRIIGLSDEAVAAAAGASEPGLGRLRLAAVTSAGEHLVPDLLAVFLARHPGADISLQVENRQRVWELLTHHEVDLAIGGRPPARASSLAWLPHQLVVVAARRPSAGRERKRPGRSVSRADLAQATWLLREPGSGTRATADEVFAQLDLAPRVLTVGSNGAIVRSVRIGLGVTLISRDAVSADLSAGTLEEWTHGPLPLERAWHLVSRADEALGPTPRLFVEELIAAGWRRG